MAQARGRAAARAGLLALRRATVSAEAEGEEAEGEEVREAQAVGAVTREALPPIGVSGRVYVASKLIGLVHPLRGATPGDATLAQ